MENDNTVTVEAIATNRCAYCTSWLHDHELKDHFCEGIISHLKWIRDGLKKIEKM